MACHFSTPSHYLNQRLSIINWDLGNKFQWNFSRKSYIFIQENGEMVAFLSCVSVFVCVWGVGGWGVGGGGGGVGVGGGGGGGGGGWGGGGGGDKTSFVLR